MRTNFIFLISFIAIYPISAQEYNYNNGNGSLLDHYQENGNRISIIKHEDTLELYNIPNANMEDVLHIFESPQKDSEIKFTLPEFPVKSIISTHSIRFVENPDTNENDSWIYVSSEEGSEGWLYLGLHYNPYNEGNWSIIDVIENGSGNWTIRKFESNYVWINSSLDARDEPGVSDSNVLFTFNNEISVEILAITEEVDTIDGLTDHWIKVQDDQN